MNPMASSDTDRAIELALLAHQLIGNEEQTWAGSPLSQDDLTQVATAAANAFDQKTFLDGIRAADSPEVMLRDILAIVWAAGFKTGSMFGEESRH
jgi:hypothetical protein